MSLRTTVAPKIPTELETLAGSHIVEETLAAHERIAQMSVSEIVGEMPDLLGHPDRHARFADLRPKEESDEPPIVLPFPYANGWQPHMMIRALMLQRSFPEPRRVIAFPNNTALIDMYGFEGESHRDVRRGDFVPAAMPVLRALEALRIDRAHVVGYSQGATVGAALLKLATEKGVVEVHHSGLFEPPNVLSRTGRQLGSDFRGGPDGLERFRRTINESAIPALTRAQRSRGNVDLIPHAVINLGAFGAATILDETNRALKKGFKSDTFAPDVSDALWNQDDFDVTFIHGAESRVTPIEAAREVKDRLRHYGDRFHVHTVEGYGHWLGDNVVAHALMGRIAVRGS